MEQSFNIDLPLINRTGAVKKTAFYLTILREGSFNVSVDRVALTEYYVFFDHPLKSEQIKVKLYKTVTDNKWYDKTYSEEAEIYTPEFGVSYIKDEIKKAIDHYELAHTGSKIYS